MKMEWVTIRPNGKPVETGTFCRMLDLEDGTHPLYYYGKTEQEANDKIALNNMNAQKTLARQRPAAAAAATPGTTTPVATRKAMDAGEVMQATVDMQNPAKAADAVTKLVEHATGRDFKREAFNAFKERGEAWVREHDEFYNILPNRNLFALKLGQMVNGDVALITKEMMTQCFQQMIAAGELVEEPAGIKQPPVAEPTNVTAFPGENQAQRVETRPVGRNGTGTRSTSFMAPQRGQTRTLKYTREQIDRMSMAKAESLIRNGDKDYAEACEFYYPSVKATA